MLDFECDGWDLSPIREASESALKLKVKVADRGEIVKRRAGRTHCVDDVMIYHAEIGCLFSTPFRLLQSTFQGGYRSTRIAYFYPRWQRDSGRGSFGTPSTDGSPQAPIDPELNRFVATPVTRIGAYKLFSQAAD